MQRILLASSNDGWESVFEYHRDAGTPYLPPNFEIWLELTPTPVVRHVHWAPLPPAMKREPITPANITHTKRKGKKFQ